MPKDLRRAVLHAFHTELGVNTFEEGYALLRKYASAKQARAILSYPDLIEELFARLSEVVRAKEIPIVVYDVYLIAYRRKLDGEDWRDHYDPLGLEDFDPEDLA